jgi:hypothetical protein
MFAKLRKTGAGLTNAGISDTGKASRYYSSILSGNPAAVMQAAAPEINTIGKQADQQKKEIANFGNRTGGTNEISQNISTAKRGQIADVISGKRGEAAGAESGIGAGETSAGIGASTAAAQTATSLGELAYKNRSQSQQIHDQAIGRWASLVSKAFSFIPGPIGSLGSDLSGTFAEQYGGTSSGGGGEG